MKIHEFRGFPNPTRVRVAAAECGLTDAIEYISVDVPGGEHRTEAFRALNPAATVPVLELADGTTISECTAITEYFDQLGDAPRLTGRTALERGRVAMMQRRVEAGLLDAVGAYFHHATPGLGPALETNQVPDWGNRQRETAMATLAWLDEVLGGSTWVAGDTFSVADITAMAGVDFAKMVGIEIPASMQSLNDWYGRVKARPSAAAA